MLKSSWRISSAFCLLFLFLGSKGLDFHVLAHDMEGDIQVCDWCDLTPVVQDDSLVPLEVCECESDLRWTYNSGVLSSEDLDPMGSRITKIQFGRPPPTI